MFASSPDVSFEAVAAAVASTVPRPPAASLTSRRGGRAP
jgi:hypothetical protein